MQQLTKGPIHEPRGTPKRDFQVLVFSLKLLSIEGDEFLTGMYKHIAHHFQ